MKNTKRLLLKWVSIILLGVGALCLGWLFTQYGKYGRPIEREVKNATRQQHVRISGPQTTRSQGQAVGVFGAVRTSEGVAVTRANVCASCAFPHCGSPGPAKLICANTNEEGRYEIKDVASGTYSFSASAPRYRTAIATGNGDGESLFNIDAAQRYEIDFALKEGGARIYGSVADAMGGNISGARIEASFDRSANGVAGVVYSDEEGRFELFVEPGPFLLRANASGYAWSYTSVTAPNESVEIVLTPGSQMSGIVVSAIDGSPVPGVEARATKYMPDVLTPGDGVASSDSEGNFTIDGLADGEYEVSGRSARWHGRLPNKVLIKIAESTSSLRLEVRPGVSIKGRVEIDPRHEPCTGGLVSIMPVNENQNIAFRATAPIDAIGYVLFNGVPAGTFRVNIRCRDYPLSADQPVLTVQTADIQDVKWLVKRGLTILGKVVDNAGRALADQLILVRPAHESTSEEAMNSERINPRGNRTDDKGEFSISGLSAAVYRIAVQGAPDSAQTVDFSNGVDQPAVTLIVRSSATLRVRLISSLEEQSVRVQATNGTTTWQGKRVAANSYEVRNLPAGRYQAFVMDGRNAPLSQTVEIGAGRRVDISFTLPHLSATLRGRIVDRDGNPLADVRVRASSTARPYPPNPSPNMSALTDADGNFSIPNLTNGEEYDVMAVLGNNETFLKREVLTDRAVLLTLSDGV